MPRKFRPKFRPIFRPILRPEFRPVIKICRHNFALGMSGVNDVASTASADNVLASDCRAQFGRPSTRSVMSHLCHCTVAGPAVRRDNALASKFESPPFRSPPPFKPTRFCLSRVVILRPPYKIQTPPNPKIHPNSSSKTEIQKKY